MIYNKNLLAQKINNPILGPLGSMDSIDFIQGLISAVITLGFIVGSIAFIFYFIFGAVSWITSGSDKGKSQAAKDKLTNAIVGIIILLALFAIVNLISVFAGVDLTLLDIDALRIDGSSSGPPPICAPGQQLCYDDAGNPFCYSGIGPCPI